MRLKSYFDDQTISVHLRENSFVTCKKGVPGKWNLVALNQKLNREEIKEIAQDIMDQTEHLDKSFLEIERECSSIVQLGEFRIVISRPPFSDGWEVTAVKPVAKLGLNDYQLTPELKERLTERVEGILIAGAPGEGKTTLARALAEHYNAAEKIVKTIESPRDLLLSDEITQYSLTYGGRDEIHDVLLLSRPDHTIFDEIRSTKDFKLFSDLRLAGIGMVGVLHATKPIDTIQRFLGRVELGILPQIVDTVVFVKGGKIHKVLGLQIKVKVPSGMVEADLARPVVEVRDFFDNKLEYEIYSYGDQTAVIPVEKEIKVDKNLIRQRVIDRLKKYTSSLEIEVVSGKKVIAYVPGAVMSKIIGKQGKEIERIEKELLLNIDLRELKEQRGGQRIEFSVEVRNNIIFSLAENYADKKIDIYSGEEYLVTTRSSKKGVVKINPESEVGQKVCLAVKKGLVGLLVR